MEYTMATIENVRVCRPRVLSATLLGISLLVSSGASGQSVIQVGSDLWATPPSGPATLRFAQNPIASDRGSTQKPDRTEVIPVGACKSDDGTPGTACIGTRVVNVGQQARESNEEYGTSLRGHANDDSESVLASTFESSRTLVPLEYSTDLQAFGVNFYLPIPVGLSTEKPPGINAEPVYQTEHPLYSILSFGEEGALGSFYIVTEKLPQSSYSLIIDANRNGDLTGDLVYTANSGVTIQPPPELILDYPTGPLRQRNCTLAIFCTGFVEGTH